ncbi:hypothetical protein DN752_11705 [Echinicola strongylocentroti]|uniref:Histone deacetylase n=1 Tax=Echinicola strongylocentroti TaxID=1795355 RepID=A0A2Z4IIF9_9BACT|nr:hypothetical protein [Echinicola strongylocentroti]AWW30734.1 hypothetical protein DN752_11705 [Echinicola strongylocentroti]
MTKYLWYASYGSNLLEERFLCYIRGGKPLGATKTYEGCVDKSLPTAKKGLEMPYGLYFAQQAKIWNGGGVAFIHSDGRGSERTLACMYRITEEQFYDVVKQENGLPQRPEIDLDKVIAQGKMLLGKERWYDQLLYLGKEDGEPIFTFTAKELFQPYVEPHESYLGTIIRGIKEVHGLTDEEIFDYLAMKEGIRNTPVQADLKKLISSSK